MLRVRKKLLSVIMTAAMVTTLFAGMTVGVSATTTITDATQLAAMTSGDYVLGANIQINASTWTPISNFTGTFDGDSANYKITWTGTATDNDTASDCYAIFGSSSGIIKNLTVDGSLTVTGNHNYISAVVGSNSGIIANVTNSASATASDSSYVGGIAGYNADRAGIYSCSNSGTITGYNITGGICGENDGTVSACGNTGAVNGTRNRNSGIGGITGRNGDTNTTKAGFIVNCYNQGNVTSGDPNDADTQGSWIGGIIGFQNGLSYCKNCYETGNIYGYNYVSYVVGKNENVSGAVANCYYLVSAIADASKTDPDDSNDSSTSETDTDMKSSSFLTDLAGSTTGIWTQTTGNYPVLSSHVFVVELTSYPSTLTYTEDASFDTTGMAITAVFDNGTTANVTGYSVTPSTLSTGDNAVFISGTYQNPSDSTESVSYLFMIPVTVNAKPSSVTLGPGSGADYNNLASALDAVASGGTIEVLGPTTINISANTQWNNNVTIQRSANYSGSEPMFTVSAGSNILTLTSMTFKGDANTATNTDTIFGVSSGTLRLRGGVKLQDCAKAVEVSSGGALTVNKAQISANVNSIINSGTLTIDDFGNTSITGQLLINAGSTFYYGGSGIASGQVVYLANTSGNSDAYITLTGNLANQLTVQCANPASNIMIAYTSVNYIASALSNITYGGTYGTTYYTNDNTNYYVILT